jgi:S1-C subfamily serine protease
MHPGIKIDRRGNALLGVAGHADLAGCRIMRVEDCSAAAKAGLEADDIILKIQEHNIPDLDALTKEIGACQPGDKVTIELRRENEVLKKEIKLGAWK